MKVVVAGLFDKQLQHVGQYSHLDLRFAQKSEKHGANCEAMFNNADRVLLMSKFTSHALTDKLDRSKLMYINGGGLTRLKDILTTLNTAAKLESLSGHPVTTSLEDAEDMSPRESTFDFTRLMHAETNSILTYTRPPELSIEAFIMRMAQGRSYYKKNFGVLSEMTVGGGKNKVDILIKRSAHDFEHEQRNEKVLLAAARESNRQSSPLTACEVVEAAKFDMAKPGVIGPASLKGFGPECREVWRHTLNRTGSIAAAIEATDAYYAKFGPV